MKKIKGSAKLGISFIVLVAMILTGLVFPYDMYGDQGGQIFYRFGYTALMAPNGKYLCAENGGGDIVIANRDKGDIWETFEIIQTDGGASALKTYNGHYMYLQDYQSGAINGKATGINNESKFIIVDLGNNNIALKANNGKYITLDSKGQAVANKEGIDKWSTFRMVDVKGSNNATKIDDKCTLTARTNEKNVTFTWNQPKGARDIIGYNLYRGTAPGKESTSPITDFPIQGTSYTDQNIEEGVKYYYILKPVYKDNKIGSASNEVSVFIESRITLSANAEEKGITLYWRQPSSTKGIIGYNLYRATSSGRQSNTPITDFPIEGSSYTDRNIESDTTYFYILKPVYKDKTLGAASNEVSVRSFKSRNNNKNIVLQVGSKYMLVGGEWQEIDPGKGTKVVMNNGRVFLPIKTVVETLGGEVKWNSSSQRVSIELNNNKIYLWIGDKNAEVNGKDKETDVAPYISESGRTMLPLRFIVENLGCKADWDGTTGRITIETK